MIICSFFASKDRILKYSSFYNISILREATTILAYQWFDNKYFIFNIFDLILPKRKLCFFQRMLCLQKFQSDSYSQNLHIFRTHEKNRLRLVAHISQEPYHDLRCKQYHLSNDDKVAVILSLFI